MPEPLATLSAIAGKFLAGLFGSLVSLRFVPAQRLIDKFIYVGSGTASAYYLGSPVAVWLGVPHEAVGFIVGLFGMSTADAVASVLRSTPWGDILSKRLGG